jgi:hypothetical protein
MYGFRPLASKTVILLLDAECKAGVDWGEVRNTAFKAKTAFWVSAMLEPNSLP